MKIFLHIALRNLLRHKRRSLITLSAIVFGLGTLIFLWSFSDGAHRQMVERFKAIVTSDAQVVPQGTNPIYATSEVIEDPESVRILLRDEPMIANFAERVRGGGIVSTATRSESINIIGADPRQEQEIGSDTSVKLGRYISREDEQGVVMGESLSRLLNLQLGDKLIVTAQDYYGALNGDVFRLAGVVETGNEQLDNGVIVLLLSTAQRLLSLGQRISKFALKLNAGHDSDDVVRELKPKLTGMGLSILSWEDLIPMIAQLIRYNEGRNLVLVLIVLAVVAMGILNTLMIAIVERTREFGLMMALGTKPKQVIWLVTFESFLLTAVGSLLALFCGLAITLYFGKVGIDLTRFSETFSNLMIGSHVYPKIVWSHVFLSIAVVWGGTLIVSLYPAWRASRLDPIEAMRQVG